jgi:hypothetical protein
MTTEEQQIYEKIRTIKEGYDKLYVIVEELEDLFKMGYTGSLADKEVDGLICAYREFKNWQKNEKSS